VDRKEYIYYSFMKRVVSDGFISLDESGLIMILEERLSLSDDTMDEIMGMIEDGEEPDPSEMKRLSSDLSDHEIEKDIYERVLKEACEDDDIHQDELKSLDDLAGIMGISEQERREIYSDVRGHPTLLERMGKALRMDSDQG
jgi:hypothetical protein